MSSWENKEWDEMTPEEKQACEEDAAAGLEELFNDIAEEEPEEDGVSLGNLFIRNDEKRELNQKKAPDFKEFSKQIIKEWDEYEAENKDLPEKIELEVEKTPEIPQSLGPFDNIQEIVDEPKQETELEDPQFKRVRSSWGNPVFIKDIYQ